MLCYVVWWYQGRKGNDKKRGKNDDLYILIYIYWLYLGVLPEIKYIFTQSWRCFWILNFYFLPLFSYPNFFSSFNSYSGY